LKTLVKLLCIILLSSGTFSALAQTSLTSPGKYFLFKNYTTQNGLLNNTIFSMAQDRHGYIWIGSNMGLTRFDGKTFYHKAIPEIYDNLAFVEYIETTPEGNIISTSFMQGLFVQQDDGRFKKYLPKGYVELGKNVFKTVKYCPAGRILAAESRTLHLVTSGSLQRLYDWGRNGRLLGTLDIDKDHRIWFGGRFGLGILQQSGTEYESVFIPEFKDKEIVKILFDHEGTLHVGTSQGYYRMKWRQPSDGPDGSDWKTDYTIEQPFPQIKESFINHIYLDKERNLWISTSAYGVFRTKGDSITLHLTQDNTGCVMSSIWSGCGNGLLPTCTTTSAPR